MKRIAAGGVLAALVALALVAPAFAQQSQRYATPPNGAGNANFAPGAVQMCLNAAGQAVPVSSGTCAGGAPSAPTNTGIAGTTPAGGTIASTGVYQLILAASTSRKGCLLQNQGTHNMDVAIVSGGTNPQILPPGQSWQCTAGSIVIGDPIYLTGTAGDAYAIWSQ